LFRDKTVADFDVVSLGGVLADFDDYAHEFVAGNHRFLNVLGLSTAAPERFRSEICLDVAGAYSAGFHLDNNVIGCGSRHRNRLEPIISGPIYNERPHCFGQIALDYSGTRGFGLLGGWSYCCCTHGNLLLYRIFVA
jgi:hypothetical protein